MSVIKHWYSYNYACIQCVRWKYVRIYVIMAIIGYTWNKLLSQAQRWIYLM